MAHFFVLCVLVVASGLNETRPLVSSQNALAQDEPDLDELGSTDAKLKASWAQSLARAHNHVHLVMARHHARRETKTHRMAEAATLSHPLQVPTIEHKKMPGAGYVKGSPLFKKQDVVQVIAEAAPGHRKADASGADASAHRQRTDQSSAGDPLYADPLFADKDHFGDVNVVIFFLVAFFFISAVVLVTRHRGKLEQRTVRLLLVPGVALVAAFTMTYLNYEQYGVWRYVGDYDKWYEDATREQQEHVIRHGDYWYYSSNPDDRAYLLSQIINYWGKEPWAAWLARWTLWHLTILLVVEYKCEVLPSQYVHVPLLWGAGLLLAIWSGCKQVEGLGYGPQNADQHGVGEGGGKWFLLHAFGSVTALVCSWLESVMIWCPNKILHTVYSILVVIWLGGLVFVGDGRGNDYFEFVSQWTIMVLNLVVTWANMPRVQAQLLMKEDPSAWQPWVGPCGFCCAGRADSYLCPPGPWSFSPEEPVGEPVAMGQVRSFVK